MSGFKESKNNDETLQFDKFKNQTILINTRLRESKNEHLHSPKLGKFKNLATPLNIIQGIEERRSWLKLYVPKFVNSKIATILSPSKLKAS